MSKTVEVTDSSVINKIMTYGLGVVSSDESLNENAVYHDGVRCYIEYTLEYTNDTIPPVVTMKMQQARLCVSRDITFTGITRSFLTPNKTGLSARSMITEYGEKILALTRHKTLSPAYAELR